MPFRQGHPLYSFRSVDCPARRPTRTGVRPTDWLVTAIVAFIALPGTVVAQSTLESGITFAVGRPGAELAEQVHSNAYGVQIFFGGRRSASSPLLLGSEIGISVYGYEKYADTYYDALGSFPVDVSTFNSTGSFFLFARLQPRYGLIRPYVEGLGGTKMFFTARTVTERNSGSDDPIESSIRFSDAVLSYGAGGGITLNPFRSWTSRTGQRWGVVVGLRYLHGGRAQYEILSDQVGETQVVRSTTHVFETRFGFEVMF